MERETIEGLLSQLMSADVRAAKEAGCELAQRVWDGEVSDEVVSKLTRHGSEAVRETLAWAIWDAQRPSVGVDWLLTDALVDSSDLVRMYAVAYVKDTPRKGERVRVLPIIRRMQGDPSSTVRRLVDKILRCQSEDGNAET